jgi:CHAT domain-containing protein
VLHRLGSPASHEESKKYLACARECGNRGMQALALADLAHGYLANGEPAKAERVAQAAVALWRQEGPSLDENRALQVLARVALLRKDSAAAAKAVAEVRPLLERPSIRKLGISGASQFRLRNSWFATISQDLTALLLEEAGEDRARRSEIVAEGLDDQAFLKGRALLEGITEHFSGGRSAEAIRIKKERTATILQRDRTLARLTEAIQALSPSETVAALRRESDRLNEQAERLTARLQETSPRDAGLEAPVGVSVGTLREKVIGPATALVDYAEGQDKLYAYVFTHDRAECVDLGDQKSIDEAVQRFLGVVSNPEALGSVAEVVEKGRDLYRRIAGPVLAQVGDGIQQLVVVPSASLSAVPFEALVTGDGKEVPRAFSDVPFLIDRYPVTYAPASPVLVELASLGPRRQGGRALVLADPLYPSEGREEPTAAQAERPSLLAARAVPAANVLGRLEKTRTEALGIARLLVGSGEKEQASRLLQLQDQRSGTLSARDIDLHLGAAASRERVQGDLRPYAILHFAAHGYVDSDAPERSGIALAFGENQSGYFTLADAMDLDLDANLVVLSACDTAKGDAQAGGGIESMARAFMYAGARGVVASLWQVADWAAADTMQSFYEASLRRNVPPSQALREAKLAVRRAKGTRGVGGAAAGKATPAAFDSGHPFFWAPFIYVGLPR